MINIAAPLARRLMAAEDRHDVASILDVFSGNAEYTMPPLNLRLQGKAALREHYLNAFASAPDVTHQCVFFDSGDVTVGAVTVSFAHTRDWAGAQPTGRHITVPTVVFYVAQDATCLLAKHIYFNGVALAHSLGVLPSSNAFELSRHIATLEARKARLESQRGRI